MTDSKEYTGHCHCKEHQYKVTFSPPIDHADHQVISCNCSICTINGYLLAMTSKDKINWVSGGIEKMQKYNFNTGNFSHYFCGNCGTSMLVTGTMNGNELFGLNVRAIDNIDLSKLNLKHLDGASF